MIKRIDTSIINTTDPTQDSIKLNYDRIGLRVISSNPLFSSSHINRWNFDLVKNQITSGSQTILTTEENQQNTDFDFFINPNAASIIGVNHYQETRILSVNELKHKTFEAFQRLEEQKKRINKQNETFVEDNLDD